MADPVVERALEALAVLKQKPACNPIPNTQPAAAGTPADLPVLVSAPAQPPALPPGVRLMSYQPKEPPVAITVCSVVTDVPKFIEHCLAELSARLHSPVQIRAGDSVFELLSKLADCGLELVVEWAPQHKPDEVSHDDGEQSPDWPSKG